MTNRLLFTIIALLFCSLAMFAAPPKKKPEPPKHILAVDTPNDWLTDLAAAEAQAKSTGMPMLILFTCSDADPASIKLRTTVIDKGMFKKLIAPRAAKLYVDFPRKRKLQPQELKANNQLKAKYKVTQFPTTVVLGGKGKKEGQEIMRIVGVPGDFVRRLQRVIR